jgi:hypothetical protein
VGWTQQAWHCSEVPCNYTLGRIHWDTNSVRGCAPRPFPASTRKSVAVMEGVYCLGKATPSRSFLSTPYERMSEKRLCGRQVSAVDKKGCESQEPGDALLCGPCGSCSALLPLDLGGSIRHDRKRCISRVMHSAKLSHNGIHLGAKGEALRLLLLAKIPDTKMRSVS